MGQWDSHHNLIAKYSVISILTHRSRTFCTKPELLNQEIQHLMKALTKCKYPKWALDKVERRFNSNNNNEESNVWNSQGEQNKEVSDNPRDNPEGRDSARDKYSKVHIVKTYTQGLGESIKYICKRYGIQTHFKGIELLRIYWSNPRTEIL